MKITTVFCSYGMPEPSPESENARFLGNNHLRRMSPVSRDGGGCVEDDDAMGGAKYCNKVAFYFRRSVKTKNTALISLNFYVFTNQIFFAYFNFSETLSF